MTKVMAVLRTLFLVGVAGYLLWAMPLAIMFSTEATREAACFKVPDIDKVASGGWAAVAWIAMEVVFGWSRVWLEGRRQLKALKAAAAAASPAAAKPGP